MSLKVDILSDLHIDFYFNPTVAVTTKNVKSLFDDIFKGSSSDILIIAGDIGHHNQQNIEVLKILQQEYYKYIICVLGNHDYYLITSGARKHYKTSYNRADEMKKLINKEKDMFCLDGNIVEIDGIKFGGCDGWYSDAYMKHYYPHKTKRFTIGLWKHTISDYENILGIKNFYELYNKEIEKIEKIYQNCDVMITHVNPSYLEDHIAEQYHGSDINTFFTFDGHKYLKDGSIKYWVFGHTHDEIQYEFEDVKCICNPLGYPSENNYGEWCSVKTIEI